MFYRSMRGSVRVLTALAVMAVGCTSAVQAKPYVVDIAASSIGFAGTHADNPFNGKITGFTADVDFDPAALDKSHIKAEFELATAATGNAMYDGTLPQADWFDVAQWPKATFVSRKILANDDGSYTASGDLTIRNITKPIDLKFTLSDLAKAPVTATGKLEIDRLAYDIGRKSDPKAEWVSQTITVDVKLVATP